MMVVDFDWSLYTMAALYIMAGVNHFLKPSFYIKMIPPSLKYLSLINQLSGAAEILLGILLLTRLQSWAAMGVVLLLIAVFPANVYQLQINRTKRQFPEWLLWVRLPLQGLLVWWAWHYI